MSPFRPDGETALITGIGLGLYRHQLDRENYRFAKQCGCTHLIVHLVGHFQSACNSCAGRPAGDHSNWSLAGDPDALWTYEELAAIRRGINKEGLRILQHNGFEGELIPGHAPQTRCAAPWQAGMALASGDMRAAIQALSTQTPSGLS